MRLSRLRCRLLFGTVWSVYTSFMEKTLDNIKDQEIQDLFSAGVHYGYTKKRRHPSAQPFIYGIKDDVEIFDLTKVKAKLEEAKDFVYSLGKRGKTLLFVSSKFEAKDAIKTGAESIAQPYVVGRWIGGTLTNFDQIRGRVKRMLELKQKQESGELEKYTKKEQLLLEREVRRLEDMFGGIVDMENTPDCLFIIDVKEDDIAFKEAKKKGIPVISLSNNDCNLEAVDYPIPGNDSTRSSVKYVTSQLVEVYRKGMKEKQESRTKKTANKSEQ